MGTPPCPRSCFPNCCSPTLSRIELRDSLELLIESQLLSVWFFRHRNLQSHVFVATASPSLVKSLSAQAQPLSALRARRNGQIHFAVNRWHFDFRAQHRFPRRDREFDLKIVTAHCEDRVRTQANAQVKIAGLRTIHAGAALSGEAYSRTVAYAGGNIHFNRFRFVNLTRTAARWASLVACVAYEAGATT